MVMLFLILAKSWMSKYLQDFERELEKERRLRESMEDEDSAAPGWQQVEVMDTAPVEINETEEVRVMDEEPVLNTGTK